MALARVLFEIERVKMVVVCRSADTVEHLEYPQRDWIIVKCCVDSPPVVKVQLNGGCKSSVWKPQTIGHPQLLRSSRLC